MSFEVGHVREPVLEDSLLFIVVVIVVVVCVILLIDKLR